MTSDNPFAARLRAAAREGYLPAKREWTNTIVGRSAARPAPVELPTEIGITDRQRELVISLLSERNLATETRPAWNARLFDLVNDPEQVAALTKAKASVLIEYLFGLPIFVHSNEAEDDVPAGHYALLREGSAVFFRIDKPESGRWAGKTFVSVQHGDDYTNMSRESGRTILNEIIATGISESSMAYGRHIGRCATGP